MARVDEAGELLEAALDAAQRADGVYLHTAIWSNTGLARLFVGDRVRARAAFSEALRLIARHGTYDITGEVMIGRGRGRGDDPRRGDRVRTRLGRRPTARRDPHPVWAAIGQQLTIGAESDQRKNSTRRSACTASDDANVESVSHVCNAA